ncbi:helix-turn-helix domain-containing protein [Bradyrhizobium sp.]|uniref:winged helix-turn-helix transcriptional regulator n=1 Tax=Bradyrhizobium sp. TaxID=376 RepID=UPI0026142C26|nr:helix-turn-helix domain-containing protein [Bradyrhizobium sp.]
MVKKRQTSFHCGSEFTLAVLGGKWKTVILCYLSEGPYRYSELRKLLPALSDKVLTQRLRDLIAAELVIHRSQHGRGAFSTYELSAKGQLLDGLLHQIYAWGLENAPAFQVKVGEPLKEAGFLISADAQSDGRRGNR